MRIGGRAWGITLSAALAACEVPVPDGVFSCTDSQECPAEQRCDLQVHRCSRSPTSAAGDSGAQTERGEAGETASAAGRGGAGSGDKPAGTGGGSQAAPPKAGSRAPVSAGAGAPAPQPAGAGAAAPQPAGAGGGAAGSRAEPEPSGSGAAGVAGHGGMAGSAQQAGQGGVPTAGSPAYPQPSCDEGASCYDFERGVLPPDGELWPSPLDPTTAGFPTYGQLTAPIYPPGTSNHMLLSRPSPRDDWPKAAVGYSPGVAFSELTVDFDFIADTTLVEPPEQVVFYRFTQVANEIVLGEIDLLLQGETAALQYGRVDDPASVKLQVLGAAAPPEELTHVHVVFRRADACTVEATYGALPKQSIATPCDMKDWRMEFGLNVKIELGTQYNSKYAAYYDHLSALLVPVQSGTD